jgi:hypothetical protein
VHKLGCKGPRTTKELLDITTNHASGEEAVGVIFNRAQGGDAKRDNAADEGPSDRSGKKNKKNKKKGGGNFVAAADRKPGKASAGDTPDYFEKMLEKLYPNHPYRVSHLVKDYGLMMKWLAGNLKMGEPKKKPEARLSARGRRKKSFLAMMSS